MSMALRRLLRAAIAGLVAAAALTAAAHSAEAADTLGSAAAGQGRYVGTAMAAGHLGEADYAAAPDRESGSVTPEGRDEAGPRTCTTNERPISSRTATVTLAAGASTSFGFTAAKNGSDAAPAVGTCTAS
ncbi:MULTISPECIES: hypothetical protein [Streptomyces]|uniref:hypothetical protein n=1 Tax=Streptomyces TaxID=1883 RepID=UPI003680A3A0